MSSLAWPLQLSELDVESAMAPGFVTCPPCAPIVDVAALMSVHQIHAVVVDPGRPRLVTARALVEASLAGSASASEIATAVPSAATTDTLLAVTEQMIAEHAPHILVHEPTGDHACGILSSFDVIAVLAGHDPRIARLVRPAAARPAISTGRLDRHCVRDVMHRGVIACAPMAPIADVALALVAGRTHAVVIFDDGVPRFLTDLNVLGAALRDEPSAVADPMAATGASTVATGDTLDTVAQQLVERRADHAIALDDDGFPVGVVSLLDIVGVLAAG
jgi:CBS domain-containing protein